VAPARRLKTAVGRAGAPAGGDRGDAVCGRARAAAPLDNSRVALDASVGLMAPPHGLMPSWATSRKSANRIGRDGKARKPPALRGIEPPSERANAVSIPSMRIFMSGAAGLATLGRGNEGGERCGGGLLHRHPARASGEGG
jgi:hypothetical protein